MKRFIFPITVMSLILALVGCGKAGEYTGQNSDSAAPYPEFSGGGDSGGSTGGGTSGGTTGGGPELLATSVNCAGSHCESLTASCSGSNIQLNWTAAPGNPTTYRLLRRAEGSSNSQLDVDGTSYTDAEAFAGVRYIYRVKFSPTSASNEAAASCP